MRGLECKPFSLLLIWYNILLIRFRNQTVCNLRSLMFRWTLLTLALRMICFSIWLLLWLQNKSLLFWKSNILLMKSVRRILKLSTFWTLGSIKTSAGLIFNLLNFDIIFMVMSLYVCHANIMLPLWMRTRRLTNHHWLALALCGTTEILQRWVFNITQKRHLSCWDNV